jgi:hypothetical protein
MPGSSLAQGRLLMTQQLSADSSEFGVVEPTLWIVHSTEVSVLEQDDFSLNRHSVLAFCWSMIFSENRYPLFGIML